MVTEKELLNPKQILINVDKGKYTTSEIDCGYRDHIHLNRQLKRPIKLKRLEQSYFDFLRLNNELYSDTEEIREKVKLKDLDLIK